MRELLAGCQAAERDPLLRAILVHHNSGGDPELVRAAMQDLLEEYDVGLGTLQEMEPAAGLEKPSGAAEGFECAAAPVRDGQGEGQKETEKDASVHG